MSSHISTTNHNKTSPDSFRSEQRSPCSHSRHDSYSWSSVAPTGDNVPLQRCKHAACLYAGDIYVFGGKDGHFNRKDLWKYNIESGHWQRLEVKGVSPPSPQFLTMVAYKARLYVFGGEFQFGGRVDSPLWILHLDSLMWERHRFDSEVHTPVNRRGHSAVVCNNVMHMYGGFVDLKGSSSELWTLDLENLYWHLTTSDVTHLDQGPGGRHDHSAVMYAGSMYLYGGMCGLQAKDDMWKWTFSTRKWQKVKFAKGPPPLRNHTACRMADQMIVLGGISNQTPQSDVWTFNFNLCLWTKLTIGGPCALANHCAVLLPLLTCSATDRTLSAPQLQASSIINSSRRPYSSPAVVPSRSPPSYDHKFNNKIKPSEFRAILQENPVSYDFEENKENAVMLKDISVRTGDKLSQKYFGKTDVDVMNFDVSKRLQMRQMSMSQSTVGDEVPLLSVMKRSMSVDETRGSGCDNLAYKRSGLVNRQDSSEDDTAHLTPTKRKYVERLTNDDSRHWMVKRSSVDGGLSRRAKSSGCIARNMGVIGEDFQNDNPGFDAISVQKALSTDTVLSMRNHSMGECPEEFIALSNIADPRGSLESLLQERFQVNSNTYETTISDYCYQSEDDLFVEDIEDDNFLGDSQSQLVQHEIYPAREVTKNITDRDLINVSPSHNDGDVQNKNPTSQLSHSSAMKTCDVLKLEVEDQRTKYSPADNVPVCWSSPRRQNPERTNQNSFQTPLQVHTSSQVDFTQRKPSTEETCFSVGQKTENFPTKKQVGTSDYVMYVLGGSECESSIQITKPMTMWKFEIRLGTKRRV